LNESDYNFLLCSQPEYNDGTVGLGPTGKISFMNAAADAVIFASCASIFGEAKSLASGTRMVVFLLVGSVFPKPKTKETRE